MPSPRTFAAVDLGASSGRVLIGRVGAGSFELTEVHRFPNRPLRLPSGLHWDVSGLFRSVLDGLAAAREHALESVGIDSWAVDYGLLDGSGALLGLPYHYRDERTAQAAERVVAEVGADVLYERNGLQFLPFNTLFQLAAEGGRPALGGARTLLLVPDLLAYWLTGTEAAEATNASTTGLLDVRTREWSAELAAAAGVSPSVLPGLVRPGTRLGPLLPSAVEETGLRSAVVTAVASHDTASAVAGVPARGDRFGYVSCGTWSLAGLELPAPVVTEQARAANFTNELGVDGTTRFLRNITGLWLLQECLRAWGLDGGALPGLLEEAARARPFAALVDAGDARFVAPGDMPQRIAEALEESGQPVPEDRGGLVRCIVESLALAHRATLRRAAALAGRDLEAVHIVGGGARNALLCQWTADALGVPVEAGPVEATAVGNIAVQARAAGVASDLGELRGLVRENTGVRRYAPSGDRAAWDRAAERIGTE